MIAQVVLLFLGTIAAFWVSAVCGGGASLILIPILSLMLPLSITPFALTVGTFSSSVSRIMVFQKHIRWKIFFWFVPFALPPVLLGAWLIKYVNPLYLQLVVALFLLANLPQLFKSGKKIEKQARPYPNYILAIVGFLAGLVSGVTGAIGLLFNRFYLSYGLSKEEIIATRAANEIFLHSVKLVIYILLGLYSSAALWLGILIAVAAVISSYTIKYILPYISELLFKRVGYGAMVISGVVLLISTSTAIITQDKISLVTADKGKEQETTIHWRESSFVLEYALDDGLEIERPINYTELPDSFKVKYNALAAQYDRVLLEKVFKLSEPPGYEFYCYKGNTLNKMEFDEDDLVGH